MKNHIAIKFLAIVLCAASLTAAVGCACATVVLVENDLYDRNIEELRQERLDSACWDLSYYLVNDYVLRELSNCSEEVLADSGFSSSRDSWLYSGYASIFQDGEWYYSIRWGSGMTLERSENIPQGDLNTYEITLSVDYPIQVAEVYYNEYGEYGWESDTEGNIVLAQPGTGIVTDSTEATVIEESAVAATMPVTASEKTDSPIIIAADDYEYVLDSYDSETGQPVTYFMRTGESPDYTVTLYLTEDAFPIYEAADWMLLELAQQYRYYLMGGLIAGILLFAITLVYLCCAAGKAPGVAEIRPQALNRLPLDIYALGGILAGMGLCALIGFGMYRLDRSDAGASFLPLFILIGGSGYGICLIIVGFLFACAAQFKLPGAYWLRHSAIGTCCVYGVKALALAWNRFARFCEKAAPTFARGCRRLWKGIKSLFRTLWTWAVFLWGKLCSLVKKAWTLLCRFCRKLGHAINRTYSLLPLTWQWLLVGFGLIVILYAAVWSGDGGPLLLGLAVCVGIILYGSNCFGILLESAKRMSKGDLDTKVSDQFLTGSFKEFAGDLNALADVAVVAAQKQMKSERMKAELITNVSHDIKTPLTSIINYVDLLQKAGSQEEAEEYLEVLQRQSQRMKKLIEDLMEMSKANTGNISMDITRVDAAEAINQALGEFADKLGSVQLIPIFRQPEEPVYMRADGRLAWRVLSNLLSNAVKYSLPGTRLYIDLVQLEGKVLISLKNISKEQLNVSSDELMERFVRGDASRNTEGSGLGLNIAKSLMELQHGQLQLLVDGDLFKATLVFPAADAE